MLNNNRIVKLLRIPKQGTSKAPSKLWKDDHIPAWASEALASRFQGAKTHAHGGQHFVPQKAADLNVVVDFLKSSLHAAAGTIPKLDAAAAATKAAPPVPSRAPLPGLE
ncbi:unnamed protein product, partial [Symbiodinium microadriaticum]